MEDNYGISYVIALHTPNDEYPLTNERLIHRCTEQVDTNLYTSDGIHWVVDRYQCFHNPSTTQYPHTFVNDVHVIQLPNFDVEQYEDDYDGSSWGEGSVVSEGDLSEAGTDSVVSENGVGDNGYESIDEIQRILPITTVTHIHQTMTIALIMRYVDLIRGQLPKKRWIRWYVFFANGNRLHTLNDEFLHNARILKFAVWTCSHHSGIFEGRSYDDCVKLIVNAICKE